MDRRIVIPVENENGLESRISQHFGRAPFFAVIDLDENGKIETVETQPNTGEHLGGTGHPHDNLLAIEPDIIATCGMGPGGLHSFQNAGVTVLKAEGNTVKEILDLLNQGKLKELAGGCEHAHHHEH
jgi:predicted Fe-Mo cluster-binding NifX family protein